MIRTMKRAAVGLAMACVALCASAHDANAEQNSHAEYTERNAGADQNVIFKDDPLAAGAFGPGEPVIVVRPAAVRMLLVRPRVQFISEMLKSVENL